MLCCWRIHQSGVAEARTWDKEEAVVELGSLWEIQALYPGTLF